MVKSHHDYIYDTDKHKFIREFDNMYKVFADPHGQIISSQNYGHKIYLDHINGIVLPNFSNKVKWLDVGCGLGLFTNKIFQLKKEKINIIGIDISHTAIKKARKATIVGGAEFYVGDLLSDDLKNIFGQFDVLSCFETLYYFKKNEITHVVNNLLKCVRKKGYIILSYHLPEKMNYGQYICSINDIKKYFHNTHLIFAMDYIDNYSSIYSGEKFGRHLFAILQK